MKRSRANESEENRASRILSTGLIVALLAVGPALAGTLEGFESAISTPKVSVDAASGEHYSDGTNWFNALLNLLVVGFSEAEAYSEGAAPVDTLTWLQQRKPGDAQMSVIRLDAGYQHLRSDVTGRDAGIEIGLRHYALHHRSTRLDERHPADVLRMDQTHLLLRGATQPGVELAFGIGALVIEGNSRNSGPSLTIPMKWRVFDWAAVEFRPAWAEINGHRVSDYDLAIGWLGRFAGLRAGYRHIAAHDSPALRGPYLGLSLYY